MNNERRAKKSWLRAVVLAAGTGVIMAVGSVARAQEKPLASAPAGWPEITQECRPWTRWWWLGSALDKENLTALLEQYRAAGLGGVEICPIYGAKGYEDRYIAFLTPKWVEMLGHTTSEGKRLGLGVDLTTGTGWPFGGPQVSGEDASSRVELKRFEVAGGKTLEAGLPKGVARCVRAVSDGGETVDLTGKVDGGKVVWTAPGNGTWRVYAVVESGPVQKVKRAAPGGEGNVVDPYSVKALDHYLARFDEALKGLKGPAPSGHFHDSFEYYNATWTPGLFDEFAKRRGYDLRNHLPALFGEGDTDTVARVKCDYRETISDLHLAYVERWTEWAHSRGGISRNQAHGAPGNLLDLYAAADVPETEIFKEPEPGQEAMLKFAASAAHVTGRKLASAESFTWLGEHFQTPLSEVKKAADFLWLAGINRIVFHGTPYSPKDVAWPGWLFYASVNFGPQGGLWHDLPAFNAYAARVQSVMQAGKPDGDVLVYWPAYDVWQDERGLLKQLTVHDQEKWLGSSAYGKVVAGLEKAGVQYDGVSDRLLGKASVVDGRVEMGGHAYGALVIPKCRLMQPGTWAKVVDLARAGATVVVQEAMPADVPGLADLEQRRAKLKAETGAGPAGSIGKGKIVVAGDVNDALQQAGVGRERMVDRGVKFVRRAAQGGWSYFVVNESGKAVDRWVPLGRQAKAVVVMDPMRDDRVGLAATRKAGDGTEVYLQLAPHESCVLRAMSGEVPGLARWAYERNAGQPVEVKGTWRVSFIEGGPVLPKAYEAPALASWTTSGDDEARRFAGTGRYAIEFDVPAGAAADGWVLELGRVAESARVRVNGRAVGCLFAEPFRVDIGKSVKPGRNTLEVDVTNVAANRIADLDRRGVPWKSFHEINFVNRDYKPFDASGWAVRDSGLLGPVTLTPVKRFDPGDEKQH